MPTVKQSIAITNSTVEKMSRHEMLQWVNSTVHGDYKKIEELCSGVAYCQMMELLFPHSINLKRVKLAPKLEHEYLHNLKVFQDAFTRIQYEKSVPIERLLKGRFQDNFEFLQWFKKFFDFHSIGKENVRTNPAPPKVNIPKGRKHTTTTSPLSESSRRNKNNLLKTPSNDDLKKKEKHQISPNSLFVMQETHNNLKSQIKSLEFERDYYYNKITTIEKILNESKKKNEHVEWCKQALSILYATEDLEKADKSQSEL